MKQYKATLLALESDGTPSAKQNKFAKISIDTEDIILKELAMRVSKMYSWYLKSGWSRNSRDANGTPLDTSIPRTHGQWAEMQRLVNQELRNYVEMRLAEAKPEWQVMAEKHGWRPPY